MRNSKFKNIYRIISELNGNDYSGGNYFVINMYR